MNKITKSVLDSALDEAAQEEMAAHAVKMASFRAAKERLKGHKEDHVLYHDIRRAHNPEGTDLEQMHSVKALDIAITRAQRTDSENYKKREQEEHDKRHSAGKE